MAEIMKPPALDESLNTTEVQSRNVADVLAQELQNLASSVNKGIEIRQLTGTSSATGTISTNLDTSVYALVNVYSNLNDFARVESRIDSNRLYLTLYGWDNNTAKTNYSYDLTMIVMKK